MSPQKLYLLVKVVRQPNIISIEKSDELATRGPEPCVTRCARAAILLLDVVDALAVRRYRALESFRVRRAIIDDDDFIVGESLREDRTERCADVRRAGIGRNDYADFWCGARHLLRRWLPPPVRDAAARR